MTTYHHGRLCVMTCLATVLALASCGQSVGLKTVSFENLSLIKGSRFTEVYFVPFDQSEVMLEGNHGKRPDIVSENKKKWFPHVLVGAQRQFNQTPGLRTKAVLVAPSPSFYDEYVMEKTNVKFKVVPATPDDAVCVTGKYLYSLSVSGGSRAMLGVMAGKSWNRARIEIHVGPTLLGSMTLDGKNLGGGYSYGYETLSVNEALGSGIAEVVLKLRDGVPVTAN